MLKNLFAAIEAELNNAVRNQQEAPDDPTHLEKKTKLHDLALKYLNLENEFKEVVGLNSVY